MIKMKNNVNNKNLFSAKSRKYVLRCLKVGEDINALNEHGQNSLFKCDYPEAMLAMIDAGINIHQLDNNGKNALFYARNTEAMKILIDHGIDINHRSHSGQSVLMNIPVTTEAMELLLRSGLDIHSQDTEGRTLLFTPLFAYEYILLINAGCDINHRDHYGETAFDYLQSTQYTIALTYCIHLKNSSPVIFKHLTLVSAELMVELKKQGTNFSIDKQCRISTDESDTKKIIMGINNLTDLTHVTFYVAHPKLPIEKYASKSFIKFLINGDIIVDMDLLKDRNFYNEIIQYKKRKA